MEKATAHGRTVTPTASAPTPSTNIVLFILCIISLALSAHTTMNQYYYEQRLGALRTIDQRMDALESRATLLPREILQLLAADTDGLTEAQAHALNESQPGENLTGMLSRLSAQMSGLSRLRRDVSQLKTRRNQRQASGAECSCPAGTIQSTPVPR